MRSYDEAAELHILIHDRGIDGDEIIGVYANLADAVRKRDKLNRLAGDRYRFRVETHELFESRHDEARAVQRLRDATAGKPSRFWHGRYNPPALSYISQPY